MKSIPFKNDPMKFNFFGGRRKCAKCLTWLARFRMGLLYIIFCRASQDEQINEK